MNMLKTATIGALAAAGALSAMVFWSGDGAIDSAIEKLNEQARSIQVFASNETAMANKINILKQQKAVLEAQLEEQGLELEEVEYLRSQIEDLNIQIVQLESDSHTAMDRIAALENEISAANEKAAELQTVVDNTESILPMSDAELEELLSSETVIEEAPVEDEPIIEEPAGPKMIELTFDPSTETEKIIVSGLVIKKAGAYVRVSNSSTSSYEIREYPNGPGTTLGSYVNLSNGTTKVYVYQNDVQIALVNIIR